MARTAHGNDYVLPPIPLPQSTGPASQEHELVARLTEYGGSFGVPMPVRLLPGKLPELLVPPAQLVEVCELLRDQLGFALLSSISGVDMLDFLAVVYHLRNLDRDWLMQLKVRVPESNEVESIVSVWPGANALERETYDMFGIQFAGHPDLRRILLDDEFQGFPLLKSFNQTPRVVHDPATTQTDPLRAEAGSQGGTGQHRVESTLLSQGPQERLHPGTPTLGDTQFHGHSFPPETWRHLQENPEALEAGPSNEGGAHP